MQLSWYSFGVVLRRTIEGGGCVEYPIDPSEIANALAQKTRFETGLLTEHTIYVAMEGLSQTVVEYRPPQRTAVFLEGSEVAVTIPLPGLLLIRTTKKGDPDYDVYAVTERPTSMKTKLYKAPLPNVYESGGVCWGNVRRVSKKALKSVNLADDWQVFLGSQFNGHSAGNKSKSHPKDIRLKLLDLEKKKTQIYPLKDLISANKTLGTILKGASDE
jgi:PRTRC genetic system protein B